MLLHALVALPDAHLVVVGDGPAGDELRALAASLGVAHDYEALYDEIVGR